jgi:hypothetical protein
MVTDPPNRHYGAVLTALLQERNRYHRPSGVRAVLKAERQGPPLTTQPQTQPRRANKFSSSRQRLRDAQCEELQAMGWVMGFFR